MTRFSPTAEQQCEGKKRYTSWARATFDIRVLGRRDQNGLAGYHLHPYHCRFCGDTHVGRAPNGVDRDRRRIQKRRP